MARYDKSRPKRPKPNAAVAPTRPRASTAPSIEDTMFFPRLRRHAKWMFVLLAVFMGLGFVLFGVGAGGVGVGDIFRGSDGTSGQSISDARETRPRRTRPTPRRGATSRPPSRRRARRAEAIAALDTAVQLEPKDPTTFRQLAGLRLALATQRQQDAQLLQAIAVYRAPSQLFPGFLGAGGQPVMHDQIALRGQPARSPSGSRPRSRTRARTRRRPSTAYKQTRRTSSRTTRTSSSSSRRRPSRPVTRRPRSPRTSDS